MMMTQHLGRIGLCIALIGLVSTACDDDDDTDTDTNAQTGDGGQYYDASTSTGRAGNSARAGRGGAGGTTSRAGAGGAAGAAENAGSGGRETGGSYAGNGGRGGTNASAGNGGTGASYAGRGGSGGTTASGGTAGTAGNAGTGGAAGATNSALTDAQIGAITSAVNIGEIDAAMLALTRAQLPAVRAYAQMMIDMHTAVQARQTALLAALDIQPAPNAVSMQVESDATQVLAQLNAASASDFDLAYVNSQVDLHTKALNIIDNQLLPNVSADTLEADLTVTRTEVMAHLVAAQALQDELGGASDAGVP